MGYSLWGRRVEHDRGTEHTHTHTHTHTLFHTHTHTLTHTHIHVRVSLKFVLYTICENEILTSKMSQALLVMMIALELGTQSPK